MTKHLWTPQDLWNFGELKLTKAAYRAYCLALKFADRKTGAFTLTKAWAAANMGCSKRTADRGLALLVSHGILSRDESIRAKAQRANTWILRPQRLWQQTKIHAKAQYQAIMAKLKLQKAAKQARLQLLNGAKIGEAGTTQDLSEDQIRQNVALNAVRQGYPLDYERQEREVAAWSEEWQRRRETALQRANYTCQVCDSLGPLDVHHRTYDRIYNERPDDLTVLCRTCHQTFHDKLPPTPE